MIDAHASELAEAAHRLGSALAGRYRLEAVLGIGGLGVVFRALDCTTGELVAVKMLRQSVAQHPTAAARFLREARIAQRLLHPAVPRGLAAGFEGGSTPYLVMEYVRGRNYEAIVEEDGPLGVRDALLIGARVASALDVAHGLSIIHRDIKPGNLMLLEGATIPAGVMVLDFGIAYCLDEPRLSAPNTFWGSLEYASPEQLRGEVVSPAADIYSLAASLVHLLTGATLFEGSAQQQIVAHSLQPVPDLRARRPDLPAEVADYLTGMLAKLPEQRPSSAREVAAVLMECARGSRVSAELTASASRRGTDQVLAASQPADPSDAMERLRRCSDRLHQLMATAAKAEARLVREIVELEARRLQRTALEVDRDRAVRSQDPRRVDEFARRIAALGERGADESRLAALDNAVASLRAHSQSEQEELRAEMERLRQGLVAARG